MATIKTIVETAIMFIVLRITVATCSEFVASIRKVRPIVVMAFGVAVIVIIEMVQTTSQTIL